MAVVTPAALDGALKSVLESALGRDGAVLSHVARLATLLETLCEGVPESEQASLQEHLQATEAAAQKLTDAETSASDTCLALGELGGLSGCLAREAKALAERVAAGEFADASNASKPEHSSAASRVSDTGAMLDEEDGVGVAADGTAVPQRVRSDSGTGKGAAARRSQASQPPLQSLDGLCEEEEDEGEEAESGAEYSEDAEHEGTAAAAQELRPTHRNPPPVESPSGSEGEDAEEDVYDNMAGLGKRASATAGDGGAGWLGGASTRSRQSAGVAPVRAAQTSLSDSDTDDEDDGAHGRDQTSVSMLGNMTVLPPLDPEVQAVTDIIMNDLEGLFVATEEWRVGDIVGITTGVVRCAEQQRGSGERQTGKAGRMMEANRSEGKGEEIDCPKE